MARHIEPVTPAAAGQFCPLAELLFVLGSSDHGASFSHTLWLFEAGADLTNRRHPRTRGPTNTSNAASPKKRRWNHVNAAKGFDFVVISARLFWAFRHTRGHLSLRSVRRFCTPPHSLQKNITPARGLWWTMPKIHSMGGGRAPGRTRHRRSPHDLIRSN